METKNRFNIPSVLERLRSADQIKSINIVVVVALLLVIILIGISVFSTQQTSRVPSPVTRAPTPTTQPRAEMWLDPAQSIVPINRTIELMVMIDAHNTEIYGSDAIINYDPTYLRIISVEEPVEPNRQFSTYDRQNEGQIQISTVKSSADPTRIPQMTLARVVFQTLRTGSTRIDFDYTPRATNKSTIISTRNNENILDSVRGATITIQ